MALFLTEPRYWSHLPAQVTVVATAPDAQGVPSQEDTIDPSGDSND
jgi:hypothetical protein